MLFSHFWICLTFYYRYSPVCFSFHSLCYILVPGKGEELICHSNSNILHQSYKWTPVPPLCVLLAFHYRPQVLMFLIIHSYSPTSQVMSKGVELIWYVTSSRLQLSYHKAPVLSLCTLSTLQLINPWLTLYHSSLVYSISCVVFPPFQAVQSFLTRPFPIKQ